MAKMKWVWNLENFLLWEKITRICSYYSNVVEAYEKAIAELIAEKEQLTQGYEKKCVELKGDSEQNSHHLASLESTFSDLHA